MKGIIAFDSVYGNTQHVAEAMAEQIKEMGHEAELLNLSYSLRTNVDGDFILIGSPTRMKQMTRRTKKFVKKAGKSFSGKPMAAFDTILAMPAGEEERKKAAVWTEDGAGPKIHALAAESGMRAFPEVLRAEVVAIRGPLVPHTLDKSRDFVRRFVESI